MGVAQRDLGGAVLGDALEVVVVGEVAQAGALHLLGVGLVPVPGIGAFAERVDAVEHPAGLGLAVRDLQAHGERRGILRAQGGARIPSDQRGLRYRARPLRGLGQRKAGGKACQQHDGREHDEGFRSVLHGDAPPQNRASTLCGDCTTPANDIRPCHAHILLAEDPETHAGFALCANHAS